MPIKLWTHGHLNNCNCCLNQPVLSNFEAAVLLLPHQLWFQSIDSWLPQQLLMLPLQSALKLFWSISFAIATLIKWCLSCGLKVTSKWLLCVERFWKCGLVITPTIVLHQAPFSVHANQVIKSCGLMTTIVALTISQHWVILKQQSCSRHTNQVIS